MTTLNLLQLSDDFRHSTQSKAVFDAYMVECARGLAVTATHWYGEYGPELPENSIVLGRMKLIAETIGYHAAKAGYDSVLLPLALKSPLGNVFVRDVLPGVVAETGIDIRLQDETFHPDYSNVNERVKTCLDRGVRGVSDIYVPTGIMQ